MTLDLLEGPLRNIVHILGILDKDVIHSDWIKNIQHAVLDLSQRRHEIMQAFQGQDTYAEEASQLDDLVKVVSKIVKPIPSVSIIQLTKVP